MLMTSTAPIDVSGLRGLHIPATPDIFPLAIGWWLVIILLLVVILGHILPSLHGGTHCRAKSNIN